MNILIPHKWLLEHLQTAASPELIAEKLSLCGPTVERIIMDKNDSVYDLEVTTNRVDCMSVRGIARELSAILPEFTIQANLKPLKLPKLEKGTNLDLQIEDNRKLCRRTLAIKLEDVKAGSSPIWLKDRLEQVGQRPLNNLIDITNYVMWEIGHPIHVFDYDLLPSKKILIREAVKGEILVTLDGKKHLLQGGEVIFDDGTGTIIDLPGIMGTQNTIVSEKTKNVLLWIESLDPVKIRQASMGLAIRSQAAVLNEKSVDPQLAEPTIQKAVDLYVKIAQAKIGSRLLDIFPNPPQAEPISLRQQQLNTYLGISINPTRVKQILQKLGCRITTKPGMYIVTPPSYRLSDLQMPQDLIEEIARIHGYHNLPSRILDTPIPDNPASENFRLEYKIKNLLAGWGLQEVYTYSMVSKKLALESGFGLKKHLKIKNPLLDEWVYLRRSLLPSLIQVTAANQKAEINIFEMQNVYQPHPKAIELPREKLELAIVSAKNYAFVKGILDALAQKLYIDNLQVEPKAVTSEGFDPQTSGLVTAEGIVLGKIGKLNHLKLYACTLDLPALQTVAKTHPRYVPLINTSPIIEDLTFSFPEKTHIGHIMDEIKLAGKYIETVSLTDTFRPPASQTLNLSFKITYRHPDRPLTAKEIAPDRKNIETILNTNFKAKLVGKI